MVASLSRSQFYAKRLEYSGTRSESPSMHLWQQRQQQRAQERNERAQSNHRRRDEPPESPMQAQPAQRIHRNRDHSVQSELKEKHVAEAQHEELRDPSAEQYRAGSSLRGRQERHERTHSALRERNHRARSAQRERRERARSSTKEREEGPASAEDQRVGTDKDDQNTKSSVSEGNTQTVPRERQDRSQSVPNDRAGENYTDPSDRKRTQSLVSDFEEKSRKRRVVSEFELTEGNKAKGFRSSQDSGPREPSVNQSGKEHSTRRRSEPSFRRHGRQYVSRSRSRERGEQSSQPKVLHYDSDHSSSECHQNDLTSSINEEETRQTISTLSRSKFTEGLRVETTQPGDLEVVSGNQQGHEALQGRHDPKPVNRSRSRSRRELLSSVTPTMGGAEDSFQFNDQHLDCATNKYGSCKSSPREKLERVFTSPSVPHKKPAPSPRMHTPYSTNHTESGEILRSMTRANSGNVCSSPIELRGTPIKTFAKNNSGSPANSSCKIQIEAELARPTVQTESISRQTILSSNISRSMSPHERKQSSSSEERRNNISISGRSEQLRCTGMIESAAKEDRSTVLTNVRRTHTECDDLGNIEVVAVGSTEFSGDCHVSPNSQQVDFDTMKNGASRIAVRVDISSKKSISTSSETGQVHLQQIRTCELGDTQLEKDNETPTISNVKRHPTPIGHAKRDEGLKFWLQKPEKNRDSLASNFDNCHQDSLGTSKDRSNAEDAGWSELKLKREKSQIQHDDQGHHQEAEKDIATLASTTSQGQHTAEKETTHTMDHQGGNTRGIFSNQSLVKGNIRNNSIDELRQRIDRNNAPWKTRMRVDPCASSDFDLLTRSTTEPASERKNSLGHQSNLPPTPTSQKVRIDPPSNGEPSTCSPTRAKRLDSPLLQRGETPRLSTTNVRVEDSSGPQSPQKSCDFNNNEAGEKNSAVKQNSRQQTCGDAYAEIKHDSVGGDLSSSATSSQLNYTQSEIDSGISSVHNIRRGESKYKDNLASQPFPTNDQNSRESADETYDKSVSETQQHRKFNGIYQSVDVAGGHTNAERLEFFKAKGKRKGENHLLKPSTVTDRESHITTEHRSAGESPRSRRNIVARLKSRKSIGEEMTLNRTPAKTREDEAEKSKSSNSDKIPRLSSQKLSPDGRTRTIEELSVKSDNCFKGIKHHDVKKSKSETKRGSSSEWNAEDEFSLEILHPSEKHKTFGEFSHGYTIWCSYGVEKPSRFGSSWGPPAKLFDTTFPSQSDANARAKYLFFWDNPMKLDPSQLANETDCLGESVRKNCKSFCCKVKGTTETWKVGVVPAEVFEWLDCAETSRHDFSQAIENQ